MKKLILALATILLVIPAVVLGEYKVTLNWDPNSEPDLGGYKIYYKIQDPVSSVTGPPYDGKGAIGGDSPISVQIVDPTGVSGYYVPNIDPVEYVVEFDEAIFPKDSEVFFVVTAYDIENPPLESTFSNEVSVILPYDAYKGKPPAVPRGVVPTEVERIVRVVKIERTITRYTTN